MMRTMPLPFSGQNIPGERERLAPRSFAYENKVSVKNTDVIPTLYRRDTE